MNESARVYTYTPISPKGGSTHASNGIAPRIITELNDNMARRLRIYRGTDSMILPTRNAANQAYTEANALLKRQGLTSQPPVHFYDDAVFEGGIYYAEATELLYNI